MSTGSSENFAVPREAGEPSPPGRPAASLGGAAPVELVAVSKRYGALQALRSVSFRLPAGEIVGLVGDNGAGKSTIVKMLSGVTEPTGGTILLDGTTVHLQSPVDALSRGVETVYQDLALAPDLPVWANFFLGREIRRTGPTGVLGTLDKKLMIERTREHLKQLQINIKDVRAACNNLSGGQRQAVAVARAVSWETKVLLMDEPTAALGISQRDRVAALARQARDHGLAVMIISHDLPWTKDLCDRLLVLYRGRITADLPGRETSVDEIVRYITGSAGVRYES